MAVLALLCGLMLAGCATGKNTYVETETSKEIFQVASDLMRSNEGGIAAGALISELGRKFPGLKLASFLAISVNSIQISYEGKNYFMKCKMGSGDAVGGTQGSVSTVGPDTLVTSIISVEESVFVPN